MGSDLVFGSREGRKENFLPLLDQFVQFRVGSAEKHAPPVAAVFLNV